MPPDTGNTSLKAHSIKNPPEQKKLLRLLKAIRPSTEQYVKNLTVEAMKEAVKAVDISKVNPANVQEVAQSQLDIVTLYYRSGLQQAQRSFLAALVAASVGLIFFIAAVSFLLLQQSASVSYISLISGALVEIISGINFYLYARASSQLATFHVCLDEVGPGYV